MALNYLSGRVSRASFGIPGFSTSGDLTVDVAGSLGIGTTQPRAEIDTPNVHIRGDIVDSKYLTGGLGYFLTQDAEGVRWVAASPLDLTFIRVFENDVQQPGLSSVSGLNFRSPDPFFLNIQQNQFDPNIADINYDVRWVKTQFGDNFGIATGFGTDGTYASIPGFGTSEAVGVTSVGVGTNQPQDDFQVGIGSTGVQINGPLGRVDAQIIKAKQLELDGNLSARSLVIDPGISTFRGRIDAQGISSFKEDVFIGFASITDSRLGVSTIDRSQIGFATIGPVGAGATNEPALFVTGLSTFAGIVTTLSDLYVGKDLYVAGQQFIKQLNADNILVTGIATLNQVEAAGIAVTEFAASGFSTFQDIRFNAGVGTELTVDLFTAGIATIQDANIGVSTIGFASIRDANVTGIVTVTEVDVEDIVIERADVGILTVGTALSVTGFSTFIGLTTFVGDVFVDGDLTVTQQFNVKDLGAENLEVTGIATINNLDFNVGIGTSLRLETTEVGIGTFDVIIGAAGTIGGVGFDSGKVTADEIDADRGRIGILTGTEITYQIGTISDFQSDLAGITTLSGANLTYFDDSFINGVFFNDDLVTVTQNLEVLGITTFRGVGTFGTDLYVGNDLFVAGELVFKQLIGENLLVSGVGTINTLKFDVGIGTTARIENLFAHVGVITDLTGSASTITNMTSQSLVVDNPLDPDFPGVFPVPPPPGTAYIQSQISEFIVALDRIQSNGDLEVVGFTTTGDLEVTRTAYIEDLTFNVGVGTDLELEFLRVGIVTIGETDIGFASVTEAEVGIATVEQLFVTEFASFLGPVFIDNTATALNLSVIGVGTINDLRFNVGTGGTIFLNQANIGVASVGLVTAGEVETTVLRAYESIVGFSTVGLQTIGTGNSESSALNVTGISTFVGFTTFAGDVFIDGNLTVNGITTFTQLDAQQSQIGILTVFNILDSQRDSFLNNVAIAGSFVASGVSTIGLSTFTPDGDVNVNRNLTVGGITTFTGVVNIDNTAFINAEVTGVATINNLYVNVGLATEFNVDLLQARVGVITDLTVTGPSTFVGLSTFEGDVFIADDLFVARNMEVGNIATTRFLDVTEQATIVGADIGIATVGFATVQEAFVGVLTTGTLTIETLDVLGVATFRGDVEIDANLDVVGVTTTGDFNVTGIATINEARIGFASITDSITGVATIGIATVGFASVGVNTLTSALTVTGLSTFTGFTTFKGDVFIDGNLDVTGFTSFTKIAADFGLIGILTVTNFLDANDLRVTGFTTLTDYEFRVGFGSTMNVVDANVSGILSTRNLFIEEDLDVGRNLSVTGITTLGDPLNPFAGFTTVTGDLYVGGDLFVADDIFYDEIIGKNLLITGIATIRELRYAVGFGTTANIEQLNFDVGVGGTLTVDDINVGVISVGLVTAGDVIIGGALTVIGPSNFNDIVTIQPQLDVLGDLNVTGISSLPQIFSEFANIDSLNGIGATFQDVTTDDLEVNNEATIVLATVSFLNVLGVGTIPNFFADTVEVSGVTSTSNLIVSSLATIEDLVVNNNTFLQELIVQGGSQFLGPATFFNDVTVTGIVTVTEVDVQDLTINNTLTVNGIATFNSGLTVNGGPLDVTTTINSPDASISTLRSLDINVDNLVVNEDLLVLEDSTFGRNVQVAGITTSTNLVVPGQAEITNLNVAGFGTIGILTAPIGTVDILTFSDATGTNLTVDFAQIQDLIVGVVTVTEVDIARAQVGLLTVTQELDIKDIRIENAYRLQTNVTGPQLAFNIPAQYRAFEVTVLAQEGANFQTTKLNGINDGVDVFFNEYSDVFNNGQVGTYSFVFNGVDNSTDFFIDPVSANLSNFSMTLTALNS